MTPSGMLRRVPDLLLWTFSCKLTFPIAGGRSVFPPDIGTEVTEQNRNFIMKVRPVVRHRGPPSIVYDI
jgi:hypothetical protein